MMASDCASCVAVVELERRHQRLRIDLRIGRRAVLALRQVHEARLVVDAL